MPAPLADDWRDWSQSRGEWRYVRGGDGTTAAFGMPGPPMFGIRCDHGGHRLLLTSTPAAAGVVTVRTSSLTRALRSDASGTIALPAADPLFDAIAFSRGRFVVERIGQPALVLPVWAEIDRVVEDCRG